MALVLGNFDGDPSLTVPAPEPDPYALTEAPEELVPEEAVVQTAFVTALQLTEEQETKLVDHAMRRIEELRREVGLSITNQVEPGKWMDIRRRNEQTYQNDLSWRAQLGGIFEKSNFTLGSGIRHIRYLSARVQDDILGTNPCFAAIGRNPDKADLAKQVEEFVQSEVERSRVREGLREAQKLALIRNETVVKTTWVSDTTPYIGPATVLVDEQGSPVTTPDKGVYIYKDDNFVEHPDIEGVQMLEKDPSFIAAPGEEENTLIIPDDGVSGRRQLGFEEIPNLPQRLVTFEGVKCCPLDYRSFLCPLRVPSIHDADINVHMYRVSPNKLRQQYGGIDVSEGYFSAWDEVGDAQPKREQGESDEYPSDILRDITVAECFLRFDSDGDLDDEEIFLVLDLKAQKPIYYNYLGNHFKKRPFEVIPGVEKIPGRWYGRGVLSLVEDQTMYEDAELNRANYRNSASAQITFAYRNACESWANGAAPLIGSRDVFWLNSSFDPKDKPPIFRVNLQDSIETDLELMETMRQASDGLIGAISLASASQSNMNQSETATGIVNLQSASDVITKAMLDEQTSAINFILEQVVDVTLENMDRTRLLLQKDREELVRLNRDEARSLSRDVRVITTRSKSTQLLNTSEKAIGTAQQYHQLLQTNMPVAQSLRPLFVGVMKSMEIDDVDKLLPDVTEEMLAQWQMQQQAMAMQQQAAASSSKHGDAAA